jgi:hypothetical protein
VLRFAKSSINRYFGKRTILQIPATGLETENPNWIIQVVASANQGCQNASKGRLKALYVPQIYPRLINRANIIVYFVAVDVFDPHISYPDRRSFGICRNFFSQIFP